MPASAGGAEGARTATSSERPSSLGSTAHHQQLRFIGLRSLQLAALVALVNITYASGLASTHLAVIERAREAAAAESKALEKIPGLASTGGLVVR